MQSLSQSPWPRWSIALGVALLACTPRYAANSYSANGVSSVSSVRASRAGSRDASRACRAPSSVPRSSVTSDLVRLTNVERTRAGLRPVQPNTRLMRAAQIQAEQMARLRQVEHVLPEAPCRAPGDRIAAVGYQWQAYAENVAYGARGAVGTMGSWMASPHHRANILRGSYTEIGTGYALDGAGRPYYAQVFGRPMK